MHIEGDWPVKRAEQFILQVARKLQSHGVETFDEATVIAGALLLQEVEEGREVEFHEALLERIYRGQMRAELLDEADCDEERAASPVEYGNHIGDFIFHIVN